VAARKFTADQQLERAELVEYLTSPPAGDSKKAREMANYARRLQRRMDEDRKNARAERKSHAEELQLEFTRRRAAERGASFHWESESLAFRTALKVLNLDAEELLHRYLPGAQDFLKKNDPEYGGALPAARAKTVADPTDVLVHTTEKDMTDG
jgi:hypothetical protein